MLHDLHRHRLSFGQERLWFLEALNPGCHNVNLAYRIEGELIEQALLRALERIVEHHAIYRTTYREQSGVVFQCVQETTPLPYERVDLSHLPAPEKEATVRKLVDAEVRRIFKLDTAPPFSVTLLVLGPRSRVLLITKHHILTDGWSIGLFNDELSRNYATLVAGGTVQAVDSSTPYTEYASAQRRSIESQEMRQHLNYWLGEIDNKSERLRLASLANRLAQTTRQDGSVEVTLARDVRERLMELRRTFNATWFVVLLAGLKALLYRLTGQTDILVGAPVAGRNLTCTHEILGLFLNTLVFHIRLSQGVSFGELIALTKRAVYDAYEHQDLPFERLVDELSLERDLERNPLFDVFLNVTSRSWMELDLSRTKTQFLEAGQNVTDFALAFYAVDMGDSFRLRLQYQEGVLIQAEAEELLDQLVELLAQSADNHDLPVGGYSLVTRRARELLPDPFAAIRTGSYEPITQTIASRRAEQPDCPALTQGGYEMTYRQLFDAAQTLARSLVGSGLRPGDVVAITGSRCPGLVVSSVGVLLARGVLLLVDDDLPDDRRGLLNDRAGAQWQISVPGTPGSHLSAASDARTFVVAADTGQPVSHSEWFGHPAEFDIPVVKPDDPAYIFFTSGTTGQPRGVKGSHRSLAHFLAWQMETFSIAPGDRVSQLTHMSFDVILREIFLPLVSGATLCLPPIRRQGGTPTIDRVMEWLAAERITVLHAVPTLIGFWMEQSDQRTIATSVRFIFSAGESLHGTLAGRIRKRFPAADIVNLYGPTEATLAKSYFIVPENVDTGVQALGRELPGTQLLVLNRDKGMCGVNEIGEIHIRSPYLTLGYLDSDTCPREPFVHNPFCGDPNDLLCPTGDAGHYRIDGLLAFDGRLDDQIKIRGVRISPTEVAAAVKTCMNVCACEVIPDNPGTGLIACIVAEDEPPLEESDVRARLCKLLPPALVPGEFVQLDSLPATVNGKVDRNALIAEFGGRTRRPKEAYSPARTGFEQDLAGVWQSLLDCDQIGIHDNFFELGGHSILAIQIAHMIHDKFGVDISLRDIFEQPTIAELGVIVTALQMDRPDSEPPDQIISEL